MKRFTGYRSLSLLLSIFLVVSLLIISGCLGGGGGSSITSGNDVQGITSSLNGFLSYSNINLKDMCVFIF